MNKQIWILSALLFTGCANPKIGQLNHLIPGGSTYLADQSRDEAQHAWAVAAATANGDGQAVKAGLDVGELWHALKEKDSTRVWAIAFDLLKGAAYSWALYELTDSQDEPPAHTHISSEIRPTITASNSDIIINDADIVPDIHATEGSVILIDLSVESSIFRAENN
tara:strand:- start:94 stop:591 length:498 start_codon:yes stop_codon:yes gene_type:complete